MTDNITTFSDLKYYQSVKNSWYWQRVDNAKNLTGREVWEKLFVNASISTLLESPAQNCSPLSRYSIVAGNPLGYWTPPLGKIIPFLRQLTLSIHQETTNFQDPEHKAIDHLPFTGGYLGWLGYDLAWEIENLPYTKKDTLPFPVAFWYKPSQFVVIDHQKHTLWLAAHYSDQLPIMLEKLSNSLLPPSVLPCKNTPVTFNPHRQDYQKMIEAAQHHIYSGDIFQANLSLRFHATFAGEGWQLYQSLQEINPSPFASYWRTPWGEVISASPERLVYLNPPHVMTRPIAGTRPRSPSAYTDLLASEKERAEHIMLVDLERNDLGKICTWGSIEVNELFSPEVYSHVIHLVSNIQGQLRSDCSTLDVLLALFPGGTITGCPKVRCLEIIEKLEPTRRSLFYGSCGYLDRRGRLDLNILIRTLLKVDHDVWGQVGAGIVADSNPQKEWEEALHKACAQLQAIQNDQIFV